MTFVSFPGVDNYVVMASFNKTFNDSLSDRTSSYFQQLSKELINFVSMIIKLSDLLINLLLTFILNHYLLWNVFKLILIIDILNCILIIYKYLYVIYLKKKSPFIH